MASTSVAVIQNLIIEELPRDVEDITNELDPVFKNIKTSNMGVKRDGIGRGWNVLTNMISGEAGSFSYVSPTGGVTNIGGTPAANQFYTMGTQQGFPGVAQNTMPAVIQMTLPVALGYGNFFTSIDLLEINQLSATQIDYVGKQIAAAARTPARYEANSFFAPADNSLHAISTLVTTNAATGSITYVANAGPSFALAPGNQVDVYSTGYAHRNSANVLVVDSVDPFTGTIELVEPTGANISGLGIVDTDLVFLADSYNATRRAPFGLQDWIINTSTLYISSSGVDVDVYPQLKSLVVAVNQSLDEERLRRAVKGFMRAHGPGIIDSIITTHGVITGLLEQPTLVSSNMTYERQGAALDMVVGNKPIRITFDGQDFNLSASTLCREGELYALKLGGGNIRRHEPPRAVPGSQARADFGAVQFLCPAMGHTGIFKAVHNASGETLPLVEAPFYCRSTRSAADPRGIRMTAITEPPLG